MSRCAWAGSELLAAYHDQEWGVPSHEDRHLFEMLILEGAQAGLSWSSILQRRAGYRMAFDGFDPERISKYGQAKCEELLRDNGIIRNRAKIQAAVANAQSFLRVQSEFGTFDRYIWRFVDGQPIQNVWTAVGQIPSSTPRSESMSKDLLRRGFKFVGPTICYAFMQAVGMVNDHLMDCPRRQEVVR